MGVRLDLIPLSVAGHQTFDDGSRLSPGAESRGDPFIEGF